MGTEDKEKGAKKIIQIASGNFLKRACFDGKEWIPAFARMREGAGMTKKRLKTCKICLRKLLCKCCRVFVNLHDGWIGDKSAAYY